MIRILLIEDNVRRIELFQNWVPEDVRLVTAASAGLVMGILKRDRGRVYAGILLDHDLQEQLVTTVDHYKSGSDVVKVIMDNVARDVPILVHSMNITRGPLMAAALESAGFSMVTRIMFSDLTENQFEDWLQDVRDLWEDYSEE